MPHGLARYALPIREYSGRLFHGANPCCRRKRMRRLRSGGLQAAVFRDGEPISLGGVDAAAPHVPVPA